ncbi:MAG: WD40 repeat domain-containing protein [Cyanobacteriota bacterium]|nr:WD40 repeat domain-containing protein [Cyanobacteriota bacterium]
MFLYIHKEAIAFLRRFCPNGKIIATSSKDNTINFGVMLNNQEPLKEILIGYGM